ncbi:unnamed protein product [Prorocentrum cordatum]|uniref:Secreted protein n=1 Tax=Prorocentrum cordatum TaxID=2364126 RepID=A0ABN9Y7G4_9DINO|nr:unnamed protein product [Polarella glacialis]
MRQGFTARPTCCRHSRAAPIALCVLSCWGPKHSANTTTTSSISVSALLASPLVWQALARLYFAMATLRCWAPYTRSRMAMARSSTSCFRRESPTNPYAAPRFTRMSAASGLSRPCTSCIVFRDSSSSSHSIPYSMPRVLTVMAQTHTQLRLHPGGVCRRSAGIRDPDGERTLQQAALFLEVTARGTGVAQVGQRARHLLVPRPEEGLLGEERLLQQLALSAVIAHAAARAGQVPQHGSPISWASLGR